MHDTSGVYERDVWQMSLLVRISHMFMQSVIQQECAEEDSRAMRWVRVSVVAVQICVETKWHEPQFGTGF